MSPKRVATPENATEDIQKIEKVIEIIYDDLMGKGGKYKVTELLKAIELKRKLAPTDDREKQFWNMINGIRRDTLALKHKKQIDISTGSAGPKGPHEAPHAD